MFLDIDPSPTPLDNLTFNKHYDTYRKTGKLNPDILSYMDRYQQRAIKELQKSFNRQNDRPNKQSS